MKPVIYYTLIRDWNDRFRTLGVTSETKYGRVNGRYVDRDQPTHVTVHDCTGRFATQAEAESTVQLVVDVHANHRPLIENARAALREAQEALKQEIQAAVKKAVQS